MLLLLQEGGLAQVPSQLQEEAPGVAEPPSDAPEDIPSPLSISAHRWYLFPSMDTVIVDFPNHSFKVNGEELGQDVLWLREGSTRLFRPLTLSKSLREIIVHCKIYIPSDPKAPKQLSLFEVLAKVLGEKNGDFLQHWEVSGEDSRLRLDIPDNIKTALTKTDKIPKEEKLILAGKSDQDSIRIFETLYAPMLKPEDCSLEGPLDGKGRQIDRRFFESDAKNRGELLTLLKGVMVADLGSSLLSDDLIDKHPSLPLEVQMRLLNSRHLFNSISRVLLPFPEKIILFSS